MAVHEKTLTNRSVAALEVSRDTVFWDPDLTGFGVRVYPSGGKVYIAQARGPMDRENPMRVTVGRHDVLHADQARQRAALIITRIKAGEEPVPLPLAARLNGGPTVADLVGRYLEEHVAVRLKPRTQRRVRGLLHGHILPALGRIPAAALERTHVVEFHHELSGRPVTANKAIKVLSHMYRLGEGWGLVPEGCNPCRSVEKYRERPRERFLTDAEFSRLGRVLDEAVDDGTASPMAVTAIRLLMLTGCRKSEILTLRWAEVDLDAGELRHAVRFGHPADGASLLVGEGIETVLSLVTAVPSITAAAALSAGSLGAFAPPPGVARLVIARDNDAEGERAAERLARRCARAVVVAAVLVPKGEDFNDDLLALGAPALAARFAPLFRFAGGREEQGRGQAHREKGGRRWSPS